MKTLGVTIGKFLPFHVGHDFLIGAAARQVDDLVVVVCDRPDQAVRGETRARWIATAHPDVSVVVTADDLDEAPEPWAQRTLALLGGRRPDFAFTSEDYGEAWAAAMGADNVRFDRDVGVGAVSGTALRSDLFGRWEDLAWSARADLALRVCVLGVESSGTTTLAEELAAQFSTVWIPEYGRGYWEGRRRLADAERWTDEEFVRIAGGQQRLEDDLAQLANRVVVCDTDALATVVWQRRYMGSSTQAVRDIAQERSYDLYLLTAPDFEFVQDGTRDGEAIRHDMHEWFVETLTEFERPFLTLTGSPPARLADAVAAIGALMANASFESRAARIDS